MSSSRFAWPLYWYHISKCIQEKGNYLLINLPIIIYWVSILVSPSFDLLGRFLKAWATFCPIGNLLSVDGDERQQFVGFMNLEMERNMDDEVLLSFPKILLYPQFHLLRNIYIMAFNFNFHFTNYLSLSLEFISFFFLALKSPSSYVPPVSHPAKLGSFLSPMAYFS